MLAQSQIARSRSISEAETPRRGLSSSEAAARLARDGPNKLPVARGLPAWRLLLAQMVHFFALLLWVASVLAFIAGMPELGIAIAAIVVLNGVFAFAQEHRAERAAERVRDLLPRRMTVIRDGDSRVVDACDLVRDDMVVLVAGDRISADLRLTATHGLMLDVSALTGESLPHRPTPGETLFAGTFVVEGEGEANVIATGSRTRLAGIARAATGHRHTRTPLARELDRVVRIIAAIAACVGLGFFATGLLLGLPAGAGFLFAIGVAVALVPEGLLPTVTLSLAIGAQRMAARHALVRRLESVETLGSTTFICTDKTGTLTLNQMSVVEVWTPSGVVRCPASGYDPSRPIPMPEALLGGVRALALAAARCSRGRAVQRDGRWLAEGDPMEAAIDVFARRLGLDLNAHESQYPMQRRFAFDARRRRASVVADGRLLLKGATDAVLPLCEHEGDASRAVEHMAARGLRVLAIATRKVSVEHVKTASAEVVEAQLELLGLIGLEDPPRPNVREALAECRAAGIRVAMVTGDHPLTAAAIAREVGLLTQEAPVLVASELPADDVALAELLDVDGTVVSRVTPEDKLRIARALRGRGHVVAMTGDGVNDGPALHEADIGVAMGRSGTDVAREAADLVLLDDDFSTIITAIAYGRATFNNVRRCLTYHLTDNVAELTPFVCWALSGGHFPLALGVLQILALDLGTDQLPALGLGTERPGPNVLREPIRGRHLLDRLLLRRVFGVLGPTEAVIELAAFAAVLLAGGWRPDAGLPDAGLIASASGAAFTAVVLGQLANAFACRDEWRWPGALGWTTNPLLLWSLVLVAVLLGASLWVPPVADLLHQAPPPLIGLSIAALAFPAVLIVDALDKAARRRNLAFTVGSLERHAIGAR